MKITDQTQETLNHIEEVRKQINNFITEIEKRAVNHDKSKLESPEKEIFDEYTPKLKNVIYGSDEYFKYLKEMKVAINHHYKYNQHHPEHNSYWECNGCFKRFYQDDIPYHCDICGYSQFQSRPDISKMNLIDIVEMFCDWKAAVLRHDDGDIKKSIEFNKERFDMSDQLTQIFLNTEF